VSERSAIDRQLRAQRIRRGAAMAVVILALLALVAARYVYAVLHPH